VPNLTPPAELILGVSALVMLGVLVGCAQPRPKEPPAPSSAWSRPEETELGRRAAPGLAQHPEKSALAVLGPGLDAFAARILLIEAAERAVDAQYYIFHDDVTGRIFLSRLLAAADRGVRVRLLLDDLGSSGIDPLIAAADAHPHLEVRLFNPLRRGALLRPLDLLSRPFRLNHRMHNKMLAVDGAGAVVGGRNIGDEYFDAHEDVNFADLDLLAFGPVLPQLGESFDLYWNSRYAVPAATFRSLRADPEAVARVRAELAQHEKDTKESAYAERIRSSTLVRDAAEERVPLYWAPTRAVADLPDKITARGKDLERTLLSKRLGPLFEEAHSELLIVSPYFIPGDSGVDYLRSARERGVRVRILTNSLAATDVPAVHAGYKGYRKPLVEAGVELYELRPGGEALREAHRRGRFGSSSASLHAKTFGFDGRTVFVGSLNLDPRSVDLNTELGLVVESPELAVRQEKGFEHLSNPEFAWQLALDDGHLVWEAGDERVDREPDTSWWTRFSVGFLALLPIEGQL
jgi:putative cardiolipin synthase